MPRTVDVAIDSIKVGDDVTLWHGGSGQGGIVLEITPDGFTLESGTARYINTVARSWVTHATREEPYPAEDCLDYGASGEHCSGPVDNWWSGGMHGRPWPRCTRHGKKRQESYENSIERYADSDCVPDWFDPSYAGERWEED